MSVIEKEATYGKTHTFETLWANMWGITNIDVINLKAKNYRIPERNLIY